MCSDWRTRFVSAGFSRIRKAATIHPRPYGLAIVAEVRAEVLATFFHQFLRDLTATLGETSHFVVLEGRHAFFIDHHTPTGQVISVAGQTGEFAPLHCTAHGKALLADFDLDSLKSLFGQAPLHVYTRNTITTLTRLARVCGRVRTDGFAIDDGEYIEEVRCVASPIPRSAGRDRGVGRHLVASDTAACEADCARHGRSQGVRASDQRVAGELTDSSASRHAGDQ